ncbi:FAD-dependent oxidoreductase [Thermobifida halotolerans]|uniref:FAD-dependent oxidoreductase n=1 Tax=Thermobifida halotolerans TaxID=483545 RepID=UPI0022770F59|nr:FAD-dependent oxidoreductase [Thermobifida halotolerans]
MNGGPRLVAIGGDAAGMSAASQARRIGPGELEILAVERGPVTSYAACGLPYLVAKTVPSPEDLIVRDPKTFEQDFAIRVHTRTEATDIDLQGQRVHTVDASGREREEPYDFLMIATGGVPRRPELPGDRAEGIFGVQTLEDGVRLRDYLDEHRPRHAVVVGAGYIGLEMAEAFLTRKIEVTVLEAGPEPMGTLDEEMGALVRETMVCMGADFRPWTRAIGFETDRGRVSAVVTEDSSYPAEVVVLGLGARPNSDLARSAGLRIGPTGGIAVDRRMRTSQENVWAAGDCVETFHRVSREPVAIALGTHANRQGRVAGTNIGGGYASFGGVVGTAVTRICGLEVGRTGLNEAEARAAGFEFESVTVDSTTRAGYFPGARPITVRLLAERRTGRLLGGQIVGGEGAAKRVDVLATALWNEMGVEEVAGMDLSYAPPFSPTWDPVLIAARRLAERAY